MPTGNVLHKQSPKKLFTKTELWAKEVVQAVKHPSYRHRALNWLCPSTHVKSEVALFISTTLGGSASLDESITSRLREDLPQNIREKRKQKKGEVGSD